MKNKLENKKVLVVGLGKSGFALMNVLSELNYDVDVYDAKERSAVEDLDWIRCHSKQQYFSQMPELSQYDFLALSPGVPTDIPLIELAKQYGIEILGEIEWAYRLAKGSFIGITGTNGKTTTTQLTYEIIAAQKPGVLLVGNIGIPAVEKAAESDTSNIFVTELSSFQLETIDTFKVAHGAILNLTPDHLNRHKTMENYIAAKLRIFENLDSDGYRVLNYDDAYLKTYGELYDNTFFFSRKHQLKKGCFIEQGMIKIVLDKEIMVMPVDEIGMPGDHNIENVLAAVSLAYLTGVDVEIIREVVKGFKGVEHRLEIFKKKLGRVFINDSKATNPDAAIKAIVSMKNKTVLLAGGMDKGSDFTEMIQLFAPNIVHMVVYGETKHILVETAQKCGFEAVSMVDDLSMALDRAMEVSEEGYTILLSPACASWDMYKNFEVRGKHFKDLVDKLG
jgi:UDP-N-acetylmuramoylalanine--D-glutamate ligase